ncbi:imidazole glycerol phosphate synthase subunit HisH [Campylobacter mucosalis]|uniref:imidazole glycerol phosphate synthase subunit HisH n=1 Tax=Campylobacter mucosalis TaxID=202 RepID=UPI00146FD0F6|nr:imidazole glycerol phosphate synthase subunit HisH [Campylobacter mucosalis]
MIGIVDYGVGNVKAFLNIYKSFDMPCKLISTIDHFTNVNKIILPGVGSFDYAMISLEKSGMRSRLDELVLEKNIPVLGICVGMQMFAKSSQEGIEKGLGWIDGVVKKFDTVKFENLLLPHMGWNNLKIKKQDEILNGLDQNPRFYFLHSFYFECADKNDVLAYANYGENFGCVIKHKNIYAMQCHPEKSHHNGLKFLKNFGELQC